MTSMKLPTKEIVVDISTEGEVTIEANGYTGHECANATKPLEAALGRGVTRTMKPEAFQTVKNVAKVAR